MFHANGHHPRCPNSSRGKDGVSARVDSRVAYASALGLDFFDVADVDYMDFMRTSSTLGPDPDSIDTRTHAAQDYHHHNLLSPLQRIPPALIPIGGDDEDEDDEEDSHDNGNGEHDSQRSGNNNGLFIAGTVKDDTIQDGWSSEHDSAAGIAPNVAEDGTHAPADLDPSSQSDQPKLDWNLPLPPSSGDHATHTHWRFMNVGQSTNRTIDCGTST